MKHSVNNINLAVDLYMTKVFKGQWPNEFSEKWDLKM